ncbi:uncharacterized protein LOC121382957 [Gigantopelta aegis]|uniref:uncharacterized protein LOC121382957 n=1 Tax=Gigantopelta aegis TaxID=1735272 RepID=UPI001B88DE75|nr:uncharacterized protein LOC121382957 [Gigantopelta aegis]
MNNGWPSFLPSTASLERQMEDAIINNDVDTIQELIDNGFHINRRLHIHGGNTSLHLATKQGHLHIIEVLLYHGADPLAKNDLNMTPVSIAAKQTQPACLEMLISHSEHLLDIGTLWLQFDGSISLWKDSNDEVFGTLIRCTPNLAAMRSNVQSNMLYLLRNGRMYGSLRLFIVVGNRLTEEQQGKLDPVKDKPFLDWLKNYRRTVQPLKHYSRLAVRHAFHGRYNVFYGARRLPVPRRIQDFICVRDIGNEEPTCMQDSTSSL